MNEVIKSDMWLSEFLAKPAYHWHGPWTDTSQFLSLLRQKASGFFCDARIPATDVSGAMYVQREGFFLADTNLYFEGEPPSTGEKTWVVRPAQPEDADVVGNIAENNSVYSRFHRDPFIPKDKANALKRSWVLNYFTGKRGDLMLVVEGGGGVCGFLQLLNKGEGLWIIDLIAIDTPFRGNGAGKALLGKMISLCPGIRKVGVGTQASNPAAAAFYGRAGFVLSNATNVFHYHGDRA